MESILALKKYCCSDPLSSLPESTLGLQQVFKAINSRARNKWLLGQGLISQRGSWMNLESDPGAEHVHLLIIVEQSFRIPVIILQVKGRVDVDALNSEVGGDLVTPFVQLG